MRLSDFVTLNKKFMKYFIFSLLLLISALNILAETPQTSFEMELAKDAPTVDEYGIALDYTINLLPKLKAHRDQLAQGKISTFEIGTTPRDFYKLYASGYLMCSIKHGICQEFLDTMLEIDIINSKIKGKASCLNMLKSWKAWLDNDLEKRHNHQTKITHVNQVSKFNKEERSKYLHCSKTIEVLIADSTITPAQFFKTRYAGAMSTEDYIQKTIDFFNLIKKENLDVYASVGMK